MELGELLYNKSEYIETVRVFRHLPFAFLACVPLRPGLQPRPVPAPPTRAALAVRWEETLRASSDFVV